MKQELRRIVALRQEKSLNQREFAEVVNISPVTLSGYELGHREIRTENLLNIAEYFDVSVEYLVGKTDCRQSIRSFDDVFVEVGGRSVKKAEFYDMLNQLLPEDRAAIYHMVSVMLKNSIPK